MRWERGRNALQPFFSLLWFMALLGSTIPARADLLTAYQESRVLGDTVGGHLAKVSYPTPSLGKSRLAYIYTPPGYSASTSKPYPVIVLLHGSPGGPIDWLYQGHAHLAFDEAIKSGAFPASIVVVPDGHGPFYKGGSEWADSIDGRCRMESAITQDLPRYLKANYRVSENPSLWSIGGLSEGAYGAANLVVRHPDVYRNAIVLSGEFTVSDDWGDADRVFGNDPANRLRNSPFSQIRRLSPAEREQLRFYIAVGADDDSDVITDNESFVAMCKSLGVAVRFDRDPGHHKWGFWSSHLKTAMVPLSEWLRKAGA
jgi:S-formylglutathione hydrolase FrmB